ncbi:hypothetical protein [Cellulosilyticum sp. WCF-2]|uniref:hypothetical protein n=1 Tax=Cellulosilyticum sp. WCF-2 TaxID=2497860 RepID=UPI000F8F4B03|nr:hypothetical protein [Cellulosilyticum sp. WCF-2]QEH69740.1 hypothetical protein EKH84_15595 [Cellulosilyticum sp. WCF-2]
MPSDIIGVFGIRVLESNKYDAKVIDPFYQTEAATTEEAMQYAKSVYGEDKFYLLVQIGNKFLWE